MDLGVVIFVIFPGGLRPPGPLQHPSGGQNIKQMHFWPKSGGYKRWPNLVPLPSCFCKNAFFCSKMISRPWLSFGSEKNEKDRAVLCEESIRTRKLVNFDRSGDVVYFGVYFGFRLLMNSLNWWSSGVLMYYFSIMLAWFWDHFGNIVVSCWHCVGIMLA